MQTILDMSTAVFTPGSVGEEDTPAGTVVERVKGKAGPACRFHFPADGRPYFRTPIAPEATWDQAAGISFWVKGDGAPTWGGIELVDAENPRVRYQCEFSVASRRWQKVCIAWQEFMPFLPDGPFLDPALGGRPSRLGQLCFGKQAWWFEWPAHSFAIEGLQLEPTIKMDTTDYTPKGDPLARVRERLARRRPITIATMGDSLTSRYNFANRYHCWVDKLARRLMEHGFLEVNVFNPAIGGHQLTHGLVQMGRWLPRCPQPDLITICFGGNDWADGMQPARFEERFRVAADHVRRLTEGAAEIMLLTTAPCMDNWEDSRLGGLAEAVRTAAAGKNCALADIHAAFLEAGKDPEQREALYTFDKVHLGAFGHEVVGDAVFKVIVTGPPFPL